MKKLFLTIGIPAAGKSTYARELVKSMNKPGHQNLCLLICRDNIRDMLVGGIENYYSFPSYKKTLEPMITEIQKQQATSAVSRGFNIVIADTNLNESVVLMWTKFAKVHNLEVVIKNFFEEYLATVPADMALIKAEFDYLKEMIRRDSIRPNSVGADVIRAMFKPLQSKITQHVHEEGLPSAAIFDIDGTLLSMDDKRGPFELDKCIHDIARPTVISSLDMHRRAGDVIIIITSRDVTCREDTIQCLTNNGVQFDELYMRAEQDDRSDIVLKAEIVDKYINGVYNVGCVYEDRDRLVELYRRKGFDCYQVQEGNF